MKKILGLVLAAMMLLTVLPAATVADVAEIEEAEVRGEGQTGTIVNCKESVNVREKASSKSKLLGTADKGNTYDVLGLFGNWVKIDFDGEEGYVYKKYIRVEGVPSDTPVSGKVGKIVNCNNSVNVREDATSKSKLLGMAKKGKTFKVLATAGKWVKIQYTSDKEGYVFKTYIKITNEGSDDPTPIDGKVAKIVNCKTSVNVRQKATSSSKLLGTAKKGATFKALAKEGKWIKIQYKSDVEGYVFHTYVKLTTPEEPIEGKTGTIKCNTSVNIRAKATKNSKLLGTATNGETFTVKGKSGNWIKIDFNGEIGYVYKKYIKIS